jgi:hypothetical protein
VEWVNHEVSKMEIVVELVYWFLVEIILEVIFFGVGYGLLKVVTLGKYPRSTSNKIIIKVIGLLVVLLAALGIVYHLKLF